MAEIRRTHVIIDLDSLAQNIKNLKSILEPKTLLMAVIKADAYGHGAPEAARTVLDSGADWLGVATPDEGRQLREAGVTAPILVLSGAMEQGMSTVVQYDLRLTVFNLGGLWRLDEEAKRQNKRVKVHLKVDTGMNRVGVHKPKRLDDVLKRIKECTNLELEGLFTHFATSDETDKSFALLQNDRFIDTARAVEGKGYPNLLLHAANSAAILDLPQTHHNMVRAGIAMYGYYPSDEVQKKVPLYPVMKWKTVILHVKKIPGGGDRKLRTDVHDGARHLRRNDSRRLRGRVQKAFEQPRVRSGPQRKGSGYRPGMHGPDHDRRHGYPGCAAGRRGCPFGAAGKRERDCRSDGRVGGDDQLRDSSFGQPEGTEGL